MEDEQHYLTLSPSETMKCMRCQAKKTCIFSDKKHPRLRRVFDPLKIVLEHSVYLGHGFGSSRSICTNIRRYMIASPVYVVIHFSDSDALTLKSAQDLTREIGNFSPKLEKVSSIRNGAS